MNQFDPMVAFEAWAKTNQARGRKRGGFSESTTRIYQSIWNGWLRWVTTAGLQWTEVQASDVANFLKGPPPALPEGPGRRSKLNRMANYTSQRFWRVLMGVYAHATLTDVISANPLLAIKEPQRPKMKPRSRERQLLPPGVLGLLRDPGSLAEFVPLEDPTHWWVLRDRAAVGLLAHCGPTPGELLALTGQSLRTGRKMLTSANAYRSAPLGEHQFESAVLELPAPFGGIRSLDVPAACMQVLVPWLEERKELLALRATALRSASQGGTSHVEIDNEISKLEPSVAPLFISTSSASGAYTMLEASSAWHAVKRVLSKAYEASPGGSHGYARGATAIRNAVLQDWADTVGHDEAATRAGLKSVSWLRAK